MGESTQLNFGPKIFGRNFADLIEFPPNQQIFGWALDKIRPKPKEFGHKFQGKTKHGFTQIRPGEKE
jgi:hypothetical protein